jgi:CBS domain-containing protein
VNVLLCLVFTTFWFWSPRGEVVGAVSGWLALINLVLAAFNSIPGYPLDGGHVLRAVLWQITGSADRATRWAGTVGAVFAQLLIALGLAQVVFTGNWQGGIFTALVGWFLLRAARASVLHTVIKHHLEGIHVEEAMERNLPAVDAWQTVEDVAEGPILNQGRSFLFVTEGGEPRGVVGIEEVKAIPKARRAFLRISQIMTALSGLDTIEPDRSLLEALSRMDQKGTKCLPVLSGGSVVGILTREQLTRILHNRMSMESRGSG